MVSFFKFITSFQIFYSIKHKSSIYSFNQDFSKHILKTSEFVKNLFTNGPLGESLRTLYVHWGILAESSKSVVGRLLKF